MNVCQDHLSPSSKALKASAVPRPVGKADIDHLEGHEEMHEILSRLTWLFLLLSGERGGVRQNCVQDILGQEILHG